ncbi:hypothetical protein BD309DRAFT_720284 [Dichomitus squalens]|nr:hypothetical protein BD309DRAFT_720284 [Dichomitus squalens]
MRTLSVRSHHRESSHASAHGPTSSYSSISNSCIYLRIPPSTPSPAFANITTPPMSSWIPSLPRRSSTVCLASIPIPAADILLRALSLNCSVPTTSPAPSTTRPPTTHTLSRNNQRCQCFRTSHIVICRVPCRRLDACFVIFRSFLDFCIVPFFCSRSTTLLPRFGCAIRPGSTVTPGIVNS